MTETPRPRLSVLDDWHGLGRLDPQELLDPRVAPAARGIGGVRGAART